MDIFELLSIPGDSLATKLNRRKELYKTFVSNTERYLIKLRRIDGGPKKGTVMIINLFINEI